MPEICPFRLALEDRAAALVYIRKALHQKLPEYYTADGQRTYPSEYLSANTLSKQLGVVRKTLVGQARKGHLRSWMGKEWSGHRMCPAMFIHTQDAVRYNTMTFSEKIQFKKGRGYPIAKLGYLSTTKLAERLGVNAQKLSAQARRGCFPSEVGREFDEENNQYRKTMFVHVAEAVAYNALTQQEKRAAGVKRRVG